MKNKQKHMISVSPFIVMGVFLILVPIFVFISMKAVSEHKNQTMEKLTGKGRFLIRAVEAGTRTGVLDMQWGASRVQRLVSETSFQPGVAYILITDQEGKILAHSDPEMTGQTYENMPVVEEEKSGGKFFSRQLSGTNKNDTFEVYKSFTPEQRPELRQEPHHRMRRFMIREKGKKMHRFMHSMNRSEALEPQGGKMDWCQSRFCQNAPEVEKINTVIFAGIDMKRAERIHERFVQRTVGTAAVLFLIGVVGVVGLFSFQAYRSAKFSLTRVKAFSDNVIQNMPAGLITLDPDMNLTSFNRTARDIFKAEDTIDIPGPMLEMAGRSRDTKQTVSDEIRIASAEDRKLRLDISVSPIFTESMEIEGFMILFKDLTELAELKNEIEKNRRLAAVGKLAGGIAHEIRNPLSSIKGFATYFKERYKTVDQDRQTAEIMVSETERLDRSVTQLLEFAKPMAVSVKEVPVRSLFNHALSLVKHDLVKHSVIPGISIETERETIRTDPDRINQVLLNLFLNSIDAMENGGDLDLTVRDLEDGSGVAIEVEDSGIGIDPEHIDHIFDPYFTSRPQGTGLGLSMVQKTVEALGGEIRVESRKGEGTCFTIKLPRQENQRSGEDENR
jgi:two-component system sensor histidine kinase HydH